MAYPDELEILTITLETVENNLEVEHKNLAEIYERIYKLNQEKHLLEIEIGIIKSLKKIKI
ncbi:MAG: hypothetical protein FWG63_02560 [Defluviitaleaceae bacterium]|nr:hypothetical protein [Defluviitaleaceae bacterium]